MISNIGFDERSRHITGNTHLTNLVRCPIRFPLTHPLGILRNIQADQFSERLCFRTPTAKRVRNALVGWFR